VRLPRAVPGTLTRRSLRVRALGYVHDVGDRANHIDCPLLAARLRRSTYYGILKTLPPVPLAAILAKQSQEPSVPERDASPGVGPAVNSLPEAAAGPPTPVVASEAAEPTKPPNAAPAVPIVMSEPAADAPTPEPVTAPVVAQLSGPSPSAPRTRETSLTSLQ
jgi:hypothetical protein